MGETPRHNTRVPDDDEVSTEDGPSLGLATTRALLEEVCNRLGHQEACEVAGLAFRLSEDALSYRRVEPWWSSDV